MNREANKNDAADRPQMTTPHTEGYKPRFRFYSIDELDQIPEYYGPEYEPDKVAWEHYHQNGQFPDWYDSSKCDPECRAMCAPPGEHPIVGQDILCPPLEGSFESCTCHAVRTFRPSAARCAAALPWLPKSGASPMCSKTAALRLKLFVQRTLTGGSLRRSRYDTSRH
jgi:hypothetical protein